VRVKIEKNARINHEQGGIIMEAEEIKVYSTPT